MNTYQDMLLLYFVPVRSRSSLCSCVSSTVLMSMVVSGDYVSLGVYRYIRLPPQASPAESCIMYSAHNFRSSDLNYTSYLSLKDIGPSHQL